MERVEGYDHQAGVHCGATALRNVTAYYGWRYSEPAAFGIGGGPAFIRYEHPAESWVTFRASPTWLEQAFFERLGVPNRVESTPDFESAWQNVTRHVDEDDPVVLFLDPAALEYLPADAHHVPPHVAVLTAYDETIATLSDGALAEQQDISISSLADAWGAVRHLDLEYESLVVTRASRTTDETDAIAAGLRQTAAYMLDPLHVKRDARGPGEEGLPALRAFSDTLGRYADLEDHRPAVEAALHGIDEHGDGAAYRSLYADALDELERRTDLSHDLADRMASVAAQWRIVADNLEDTLTTDDPADARFGEAASLVADIADREATIYRDLGDQIGLNA